MNVYRNYIKRFLDIILSIVAIIILSPVLLIVAILVRLKLGSPVIFKQERPGKDERLFKLYKFRTMTNELDEKGGLLPPYKRVTSFGKFLRTTSLDELPELWNILRGDMSFVGPRPLKKEYLDYYTQDEKKRHVVRPGLTGLAQIKGRNNIPWKIRLGYDLQYIEKESLAFDFIILLKTFIKVFKRENIVVYGEGEIKSLDVERAKK